MGFETVRLEVEEPIARVVLNRPQHLNVYNLKMRDELTQVFEFVRDVPEIRGMIVSGAGRAYCAGADLSEFGTAPSPVIARDVRWQRDLWGVLRKMNKLTVAAMHGFALGSGLELALLCDLRLAAEGTVFGLPEAMLGMIPAAGGTQSLPRVVKRGHALHLVLTGARINVNEAYRIGLVNSVVPREHLLQEADRLTWRVLANPARAVALAKAAVRDGLDLGLSPSLRLERRLACLAHTPVVLDLQVR